MTFKNPNESPLLDYHLKLVLFIKLKMNISCIILIFNTFSGDNGDIGPPGLMGPPGVSTQILK